MKLTVLKIQKQKSRYGKEFWYVFLKSDAGHSFKSCVSPMYGNWLRNHWNEVVQRGAGCVLQYPNMPINARGLLDADIQFTILPKLQETADENQKTQVLS